MLETSPNYHILLLALASSKKLVGDLHPHRIENELDELKLRSYILLCHAAFEEYLETVSWYAINQSRKAFIEDGNVREPLINLVSFYSIKLCSDTNLSAGPFTNRQIFIDSINIASGLHYKELQQIHGIKTKDQDTALMPIGIRVFDFDRILSQQLNTLGARRGEVAHKHRINITPPRISLETSFSTISSLFQGLDNEICKKIETVVM